MARPKLSTQEHLPPTVALKPVDPEARPPETPRRTPDTKLRAQCTSAPILKFCRHRLRATLLRPMLRRRTRPTPVYPVTLQRETELTRISR